MAYITWIFGFFSICILNVSEGMRFTVTPTTFVPGVTSSVTMRCDVADSGLEMSQLLLVQLEKLEQGRYLPIVTFTPGTAAQVTPYGVSHNAKVQGAEHQFQNISTSYLAVTFPFPVLQLAGNFTCVVSGLSSASLLTHFSRDAALTVGAVDELPHFMTARTAELRSLIESIKKSKDSLLLEAAQLRDRENNASLELASLEKEYANLTAEMTSLRSRASHLMTFLNQPVSSLDHLSSVRPEQKVAFHAALSTLGAKAAVLHVPLVFDHVITNEGQGYDSSRGVFKAPVAATYLLAVSLEAGAGHRDSELSLMSDGHVLQTMHLSDDLAYQHHSTSTIVHLYQGQEVTCQFTWLNGNPGYLGSSSSAAPYISAFTGYILW